MKIKASVGSTQLRRNMREMANVYKGSMLEQDMKTSLEPMRSQTEENARALRQPGRTPRGGHLDQGVVSVPIKKRGPKFSQWWISFKGRARNIAHLVEFGTAPHWQPNRFGVIMHPGARQTPFARTAYETTKGEVVQTFTGRVWARMQDKLRGLRK